MLTICTISKTYDEELIRTLRSLFIQKKAEYKLILIVSKEDSIKKHYKKINEYLKFFIKSKVLYKHFVNKDNSIYDAMNLGLQHSNTSHLLYLNAGDKFSSKLCIELINQKISEEPEASHAFSVFNIYKKNVWIRNSKKNFINFLTSPNYQPPHQGFVAFIGKKKFKFSTQLNYNADSKWIEKYTLMKCIYHKKIIAIFKLGGISSAYDFKSAKFKLNNPRINFITKIKICLKFIIFQFTTDSFAYKILHFFKGFPNITRTFNYKDNF